MSRKAKGEHAQALSAFLTGRITRHEYQTCCIGYSVVDGNKLWFTERDDWAWEIIPLYKGRAAKVMP